MQAKLRAKKRKEATLEAERLRAEQEKRDAEEELKNAREEAESAERKQVGKVMPENKFRAGALINPSAKRNYRPSTNDGWKKS